MSGNGCCTPCGYDMVVAGGKKAMEEVEGFFYWWYYERGEGREEEERKVEGLIKQGEEKEFYRWCYGGI